MTSHCRQIVFDLALVIAAMGMAAQAAAQAADQTTAPPAQAIEVTDTTTQIPPQLDPALERPYWASIGGYEFDTHATGYGFFGPSYVRPFRRNMAFVAGANVNYLHYEFDSSLGETQVRSPGLSTGAGLRFGDRNWFQLKAGPSFKREHRRIVAPSGQLIQSDKELVVGFSVGADTWINPTRHNNIHGMLHYGTDDGYLWSRLGFKEQIGNHSWRGRMTPYLGVEFVGQGNEDIRSIQFGPFVELLHTPSSLSVMLRGGYKRSSFDIGPNKTGPWMAISVYQRIR